MKNLEKVVATYNLVSKGLFACAIGIIGFMLGGLLLAVPSAAIGILGGNLLEKTILKLIKTIT